MAVAADPWPHDDHDEEVRHGEYDDESEYDNVLEAIEINLVPSGDR